MTLRALARVVDGGDLARSGLAVVLVRVEAHLVAVGVVLDTYQDWLAATCTTLATDRS